jgi:hypothetical protein
LDWAHPSECALSWISSYCGVSLGSWDISTASDSAQTGLTAVWNRTKHLHTSDQKRSHSSQISPQNSFFVKLFG